MPQQPPDLPNGSRVPTTPDYSPPPTGQGKRRLMIAIIIILFCIIGVAFYFSQKGDSTETNLQNTRNTAEITS